MGTDTALFVGARVVIFGLESRPELNGLVAGIILFDDSSQRWGVRAVNGARCKVRAQNLRLASCDETSPILRVLGGDMLRRVASIVAAADGDNYQAQATAAADLLCFRLACSAFDEHAKGSLPPRPPRRDEDEIEPEVARTPFMRTPALAVWALERLPGFRGKDCDLLRAAAAAGCVGALEAMLARCPSFVLDESDGESYRTGAACSNAAGGGHLDMLRRLRELGCPWDWATCSVAAAANSKEVLEWALAQGADPSGVITNAACSGHLALLKWAREERQLPWDKYNHVSEAAQAGQVACLAYMLEAGCPFERASILAFAAGSGSKEVMRLLRAHGAQWHPQALEFAVRPGSVELLEWMLKDGCPCDGRTTDLPRAAIGAGHLHVLRWLVHTRKCQWDARERRRCFIIAEHERSSSKDDAEFERMVRWIVYGEQFETEAALSGRVPLPSWHDMRLKVNDGFERRRIVGGAGRRTVVTSIAPDEPF